jgi:hypothetical protein
MAKTFFCAAVGILALAVAFQLSASSTHARGGGPSAETRGFPAGNAQ